MNTVLPAVDVVVGPRPGPVVGLLGGIHGDEYEGVVAARRIAREVRSELLCGELRIAAPAHPAAWAAATRSSPTDGHNLARVFPGRSDGDPTEQIASFLTERIIRGADLLIDLHSAGTDFDMPVLCGYQDDASPRADRSRHFAEIFAAPFTWIHRGAPAPGRSLSAAHELGVPAIYVESHGGRSIQAEDLAHHIDGVRRVLYQLGMISGDTPRSIRSTTVEGDGNTDIGIPAPAGGYLVAHHQPGAFVKRGETIVDIVTDDGTIAGAIAAPDDCFVMLLRRDARVSAGETACIVARGVE